MTAADLALVLNAVNVPVCFTALVAGIVVISVKRAFQRADDKSNARAHTERIEQMRLASTKEISVRSND